MRRQRNNDTLYLGLGRRGYAAIVLPMIGRVLYRYRWPLIPAYVALGIPPTAWTLAIVWASAGAAWVAGAFAVAGICAGCWLALGARRLYDRLYGLLVTVAVFGLVYAIARHPGRGELYGLLALGWPLVGLGWWCGSTFRNAVSLDRMRHRWESVAQLAGIPGAILTTVRSTPVGRVLRVKLAGEHTARDVHRERIEVGYQLRPGSVTVVRDRANARRVDLHIVDRDPWTRGEVVDHPAIAELASDAPTIPLDQPTTPDIESDSGEKAA